MVEETPVVDKYEFIRSHLNRNNTEVIECPAKCGQKKVRNTEDGLAEHFDQCPAILKTCSCCKPSFITKSSDHYCNKKLMGYRNTSADARTEVETGLKNIRDNEMRLSSYTKAKSSGNERLQDPEKLIEGLDRKILLMYRPTA